MQEIVNEKLQHLKSRIFSGKFVLAGVSNKFSPFGKAPSKCIPYGHGQILIVTNGVAKKKEVYIFV